MDVRKDLNATAKRLMVALYQSDIEGNSVEDQRKDFSKRFATMQSNLDVIREKFKDKAMAKKRLLRRRYAIVSFLSQVFLK